MRRGNGKLKKLTGIGDRKALQRRGRIKVKVERARHPGNVGEILRRGARASPGSQELGGGR